MALDPTRAALVTQEYRYTTREDPSIKAKYANAREIIIPVNLDQTGAAEFATSIFNATKDRARAYDVPIEGVLYPEDFIGGAPRYTIAFERFPEAGTSPYAVATADVDFFTGLATIKVHG